MRKIWILILSFAVSGLTQDSSSSTLFLISAPEVLHAGTAAHLAVTVYGNLSSRVTAEVTHGDAKVAQTEDFTGGLTRLLTLPPILGSIPQNSLLDLTVRGYKENILVFANTTTVSFNLRNVCSFIQTDRSRYKPGDTVKVRVVSVQLDNRPYQGSMELSLQDPSGRVVGRQGYAGSPGMVTNEFPLPETSPLGQWKITITGRTDEKAFIVEHREDPAFEVLIKTSSQTLTGDNISGSVRALYPNGQPVHGTLVVSVTLKSGVNNSASSFLLKETKEIQGSSQFFFSKDQLQPLFSSAVMSREGHVAVNIAARVNDIFTGFKINKVVEVNIMEKEYQLMFLDFPSSIRPSLHFSTSLRISRYDQQPLSSEDLLHPAVIEVTQTSSLSNTDATTLTLPVPKDGNVQIKLKVQNQVTALVLRAKFQSSEETLTAYNNYSSPSGSYIQILSVSSLPAKIGVPLQLNVESTFKLTTLNFVVSSNGQVVTAGTKNSSSFSLSPELSWSPQACVRVYCILADGELVSDTAHIPLHPHNLVTLNWSRAMARPGEEVSLTVAAAESRFAVGMVVVGTSDDAPLPHPDVTVSQEPNLKILTNAKQFKKPRTEGSTNALLDKEKGTLIVERYWSRWLDTTDALLWVTAYIGDKNWTSEIMTVPDGVTSLRGVAVVMSENLGLTFTPVPQKLTVSKDFSLSLSVPPHLIRGEEIVLEIEVINHLENDAEVIVLLAQSEAFNFVVMDRKDVSVINAQKLTIKSHATASALFPIRPFALGEMEISVDAVSAEASDALVRRVLVKPEGVQQLSSQTLFLELEPEKQNNSKSISFSFPPLVVPGSHKAQVALVGDILALSIDSLDSLVQTPVGCGEQNMIHFAPSVYVLQYLEKSTQDDEEIRSKALRYMEEGYQKQLSYRRDDGSFSAFGMRDTSGSTWLTAFVLRCFLQAQPYMQVDQTVLRAGMAWLLRQQGPQGDFREVGQLIHTELQGGLVDSPVALTAFVLLAFLEDDAYWNMYQSNVSLSLRYLERKVTSNVVSSYGLCLAAYALSLGNSVVAGTALSELSRRADFIDGVMMWRSSAGLTSHDWPPHSVQIEMASYVLLALFIRGSFIESIPLMKWLTTQRNHLGGFGTTQDTVVALQALAYYAAFSGANAIDLRFDVSSPSSSLMSVFHINSTNYRMHQSQEINADRDLPVNVYFEGRGFALFQLNVFYNVKSEAFSETLQQPAGEEAFWLRVNLTDDSQHWQMTLSVCTRLKDSQPIAVTGMAILDVGMLSGFSLSSGAALQGDLIKAVEATPEKVILYLDSLTKKEVCVRLPIVRSHKVARVQDATVQVYDYYEPTRAATVTYNSPVLRNMASCSFCGENCDLCRPGITITTTFPLSGRSVGSSPSSLSCLFLCIIALLTLV